MNKIPILLITHNRPYLLDKVLNRLIKFTPWDAFELWILDNDSTIPNKRIISAYLEKYHFIKVFSQNFNQISCIQNDLIKILKRDIYIKLDDDILVSENWYQGFLGVFNRHNNNISIGSVTIPINGFGWVPFINIMGLQHDFKLNFPDVELIQGCMEPAVWNNSNVCEYLWNKSLNIDEASRRFCQNRNEVIDYEVNHRYSIGAIIFSHNFWEKMGGWKEDPHLSKKIKLGRIFSSVNDIVAKIRGKENQTRVSQVLHIISGLSTSALGLEEEYLYKYSSENGFQQFVTTESIVHHFSFHSTEDYLMKKVYLNIHF